MSRQSTTKSRKGPSGIAFLYLIIYNVSLAVGWSYVFFLCVASILKTDSKLLWPTIEVPLKICQTAAVLEVFHAVTGLVPSGVISTALQVASRIGVLWGIVHISSEAQQSAFLTTMVTSWSMVEIPRYLYYASNLAGSTPHILKWLRYSLFVVLYPSGIISELGSIYVSLPLLKESHILSLSLPNIYNFAFNYHYAVLVAMFSYLPGSPFLYSHMLALRRKYLSPVSKDKST